MLSQHQESIQLYHKLSCKKVMCDPTLGVDFFYRLTGASPGAGGAILLDAKVDENRVVLKVFPTDCEFKYLKDKVLPNKQMRDYGNFELGTGILLTELFVLPSLSQNITTCYNMSICKYAYEGEISVCTRRPIPKSGSPIPNPCIQTDNPLCIMNDTYHIVNKSGPFDLPMRGDEVRFLMAEKCVGDMQGLLEKETIDETELYYMLCMIFHTLSTIENKLGKYTHHDLGLRNILYAKDKNGTCDTYWRYQFADVAIDIPTTTLIPKIWDFAFVRFANAEKYKSYYEYLTEKTIPDLSGIQNRDNDVYVILQDVQKLLHAKDSLFLQLDLDKIRSYDNNHDAIQEFYRQMPISDCMLARSEHIIIHNF